MSIELLHYLTAIDKVNAGHCEVAKHELKQTACNLANH